MDTAVEAERHKIHAALYVARSILTTVERFRNNNMPLRVRIGNGHVRGGSHWAVAAVIPYAWARCHKR